VLWCTKVCCDVQKVWVCVYICMWIRVITVCACVRACVCVCKRVWESIYSINAGRGSMGSRREVIAVVYNRRKLRFINAFALYRVCQKCGNPLIFRKIRIFKKNVWDKSCLISRGPKDGTIGLTLKSHLKVTWRSLQFFLMEHPIYFCTFL